MGRGWGRDEVSRESTVKSRELKVESRELKRQGVKKFRSRKVEKLTNASERLRRFEMANHKRQISNVLKFEISNFK